MEEIIKIIDTINNMTQALSIEEPLNEAEFIDYDKVNVSESINNVCEYVDNFTSLGEITENFNYCSPLTENITKREDLYENINNSFYKNINEESFFNKNIHSQNISNKADYSSFSPNFVDNSEKSVDNGYFSNENNKVFHNNYGFKEIYSFMQDYRGDKEEKNSFSDKPVININMGGITQNITGDDGNNVLEELSDILVRALSGCDGVY